MTKRPNFLFIITDQQRADWLGCYGHPVLKTPNIDSIAAQGTRFDNFHAASPVCMPNRASIMTGRMCSNHGARHNGIPLSKDHTTFVELLRDAGYRTGLIGKSHLQSFTGLPATNKYEVSEGLQAPSPELRDAIKNNRHGPEYDLEVVPKWTTPIADRMDETFYGFEHVEIAADHADKADSDYKLWAKQQRNDFEDLVGPENALEDDSINAPQAWRTAVPEELYSTNWIADRSEAFLADKADGDEPFFLQMSFPDPHHPFTPPGRYWDMYDPADIELPATFGKGDLPPIKAMREAMEAGTDPRDNQSPFAVTEDEARAIIALTYGMITMIDDAVGRVLKRLDDLGLAEDTIVIFTSDHGDYMGDHGTVLKHGLHSHGLIRVPLIWNDPAGPGAHARSIQGSAIDFAPTILQRAGVKVPYGMQGRDLLGENAPNLPVLIEDAGLGFASDDGNTASRTLVHENWRMSVFEGSELGELFNLAEDPHELRNLWADPVAASQKAHLMHQLALRMLALRDTSLSPTHQA